MAKDAECGCGIDCNCYGYVVLPNWDSTAASTEPVDSRALFIVDATLYIGTVAEAQAVIDGIKAGTPLDACRPCFSRNFFYRSNSYSSKRGAFRGNPRGGPC
jgi:hypothetical protein